MTVVSKLHIVVGLRRFPLRRRVYTLCGSLIRFYDDNIVYTGRLRLTRSDVKY